MVKIHRWRPFINACSKRRSFCLSHQQIKILTYPGSTSKRMRKNAQTVSVQIIQQGLGTLTVEEALKLQLNLKQRAWIREVVIFCDHHAIMTARAVIPYHHFFRRQNPFQLLGKRTLGEWLFSFPSLSRSRYEYRRKQVKDAPQFKQWLDQNRFFMERRSVFCIKQDKVLLTEQFFPKTYFYLKSEKFTKIYNYR